MPAQRLEEIAPVMKKKGRIREGADADITIFDPDRYLTRQRMRNQLNIQKG